MTIVDIDAKIPNNVDLAGDRRLQRALEQFKDFVNEVHNFGVEHFDAALIDGRCRVECAKELLRYIDQDSVVFLHDFHRKRYQPVLQWYECLLQVRLLGVLRKKG